MTPEALAARHRIIRGIREFFWSRGFLEVETPVVTAYPSQEPTLEPLRTVVHDHRGKAHDGFLRMSPEFSLKKLLARMRGKTSGVDRETPDVEERMPGIFELGPAFRDGEPWGETHNPEFTMLEWYHLGATYRDLMSDCEELVFHCASAFGASQRRRSPKSSAKGGSASGGKAQSSKQIQNFNGQNNFSPSHWEGERRVPRSLGEVGEGEVHSPLALSYQRQRVDLTPPWERLTMRQAWKRYAHLDLDQLLTRAAMARACQRKGYTVTRSDILDDLFFKIHLTEVESRIGRMRPTFLTDWPASMAALARKKPRDPRYAERVELYIGGLEIANGFSELTDADEQLARFRADQRLRQRIGRRVYPIDKEFIAALRRMPPTAGIALGVDRLVMLLVDAATIDEVRWLPASVLFGRRLS